MKTKCSTNSILTLIQFKFRASKVLCAGHSQSKRCVNSTKSQSIEQVSDSKINCYVVGDDLLVQFVKIDDT